MEVEPIERITVKIMKHLSPERLSMLKNRLIDIAEDGVIDEEERPELKKVLSEIDQMAEVLHELQLLGEKILKGGEGV